jgi:hypothetical protein
MSSQTTAGRAMTSTDIATTADPVSALPLKSVLDVRTSRLRPLPSAGLGCGHELLVFDEINDVRCGQCGEDFTD